VLTQWTTKPILGGDEQCWTRWSGWVPSWGIRRRKKSWQTANGVIALRGVFLSFVIAIALIGVVAWVLGRARTTTRLAPETILTVLVVAAGVAALSGARLFARPLRCNDESDLVASYSSKVFVRMACAEAPALVGFAATVASGNSSLYAVGASLLQSDSPAWRQRRRILLRAKRNWVERGVVCSR
jgi:hypothetical protein